MIHERQHISNKIHEMLNEITDLNWRDATDLKSELQNIGVRWGVTHPSCNRVDFDTTIKCEKIKQFIFYRCSTCGRSLYMEFEAKRQPNNFVLLGQRLRIRQAYVLWLRDWSKSIGGGGGWAGAFGNVVDKKHMTHPLPSAKKWVTHP